MRMERHDEPLTHNVGDPAANSFSLPQVRKVLQVLPDDFKMIGRMIREGFSSAMAGVMKRISLCVQAINCHDEYYDKDDSSDDFEPVPLIWISGEKGVGKRDLVQRITSGCGFREYLLKVDCQLNQESKIRSELFGDAPDSFEELKNSREGKFSASDAGLLAVFCPQRLPIDCQRRIDQWQRSGRMEYDNPYRKDEENGAVVMLVADERPETMVARGAILKSLLHRVLANIYVLPLRERREDIVLYLKFFLKKKGLVYRNEEFSLESSFEDEALVLLVNHGWPDNLHGLQRFIEHTIYTDLLKSADSRLTVADVRRILSTLDAEEFASEASTEDTPTLTVDRSAKGSPHFSREDIEHLHHEYLVKGYTQSLMAVHLGVHHSTISRRRKKLGLPPLARGRPRKGSTRSL
jgi:DNA-binding NtrC family response regulator